MSESFTLNIVPVTQPVIAAVKALLDNGAIGFNTTFWAVAAKVTTPLVQFDFSEKSVNFYEGYYSPEILAQTSPIQYPLMTIYGMSSENAHEQISAPFSGPVQIGLDIHLSWMKTTALHHTDKLVSAVESTLYTMLQPDTGFAYVQGSLAQNGVGLAGFGKVKVTRTALRADAQHWLQSIKSVMTFDIVAGN